MIGRATAAVTARLGTMGDHGALSVQQFCGADSCEGTRVTALGDENLCCDHFLARCYQLLERLDQAVQAGGSNNSNALEPAMRTSVEECSRKVLEVALGKADLDNLQRARLLDILLWSSDLLAGGNSREGSPFRLTTIERRGEMHRSAVHEEQALKPRGWRTSISY